MNIYVIVFARRPTTNDPATNEEAGVVQNGNGAGDVKTEEMAT